MVQMAAIAVVGWLCAFFFFVKSGYVEKVLIKLGLRDQQTKTNWTAFSWESCLRKMDCQADVVFMGDSIVRGGDFHKAFPAVKIVNLGCSGDTLSGMLGRVSMLEAVFPKKVFFMGGINGLTDHNLPNCVRKFEMLLNKMKEQCPEACFYVHSVLPIAKGKEKRICKNATIRQYNKEIKAITEKQGEVYIDLYSLYEKSGEMDPNLTVDGLHLQPEAYTFWIDAIKSYMER